MMSFIHAFITRHWILSFWVWLILFLLVTNHLVHLFNKKGK